MLLSAHAAAMLAAPLAQAAERAASFGIDCRLITLEAADADDALQVHAAFISRDITGPSTKVWLSRETEACYAVLRRSPALQWVHAHSAGADRPIYPELRARGVAVTTSAGANAPVVAQAALGGLLALSRRFPHHMAAQRERRWAPLVNEPVSPPDLAGQTAVIVGWGPIARHLQPWLAMLRLKTVVVRRSGTPAAEGVETVPFEHLHGVLPRADWLVLACPLTPQTRRLVNAEAFAALKPGAMLVNVARGEVVDEAALVQALRGGRLAGAFLDVFEVEPLPAQSPLWAMPQVMVSPHSAGQADGNAARVGEIFLDNLGRWLQGRALVNEVSLP